MKKCTLLANRVLTYTGIGLIVYMFALLLLCFLVGVEIAGCLAILAMILFMVIVMCCITPRWFLLITFDENGVTYRPLFRKGIQMKYSDYPRIQYAYYMHGNGVAAYKVHFFVLTDRRLSYAESSHINDVAPAQNLIKIRYTRKTYQKLISVLPPTISFEIELIYKTYIQKDKSRIQILK